MSTKKKHFEAAVVAIAKDESAYIHEWVHHYLYFGFKEIYIAVNRTTDSSLKILEKLSKKNEQVHFREVDWLDQCVSEEKNKSIQSLSYAYLSSLISKKHPSISHILYVDMDEFWFTQNFEHDVSEYLASMPPFDLACFPWLCQNGDNSQFEMPFKNLGVETGNPHIKSMLSVAKLNEVKAFRCHTPVFDGEENKLVDPEGSPVETGRHDQMFKKATPLDSSAAILHRMLRSELEYTALLMRERPGIKAPIKNNRRGFKKSGASTLNIPKELLSRYWADLDEFVKETKIKTLLDASRSNIRSKAEKILDPDDDVLIKNLAIYAKVLEGTRFLDTFKERLLKIRGKLSQTELLDHSKSMKKINNHEAARILAEVATAREIKADSKTLPLKGNSNISNFKYNGEQNDVSIGENIELTGYIIGKNNVIIIENADQKSRINLNIRGSGNLVYIKRPAKIHSMKVNVGTNVDNHESKLIIEPGLSSEPNFTILMPNSGSVIKIDKKCMFSHDVKMRCGESPHLIFDNNDEYLDVSEGIFIGERCWVGEGVFFTKNVTLPNETIVGAKSVVTRRFDTARSVIAGNPAQVVRKNVAWVRNSKMLKKDSKQATSYNSIWSKYTGNSKPKI